MNLALIRRQFAAVGGAELYLQRLLSALVSAGHATHLYTSRWEGAATGVTVHQVPMDDAGRSRAPLVFAQNVDRLLQRPEADQHDVIFSLERTLRQDVYRAGDGVHAVWLDQRKKYAPWWKRYFMGLGAFHRHMLALERQVYDPDHTRRIIVNSEMVGREVVQRFGYPAERIHLVRNGVVTERFRSVNRDAARAEIGFQADDYVLLFVGSGWERKGLSFLLNLMKKWQDAEPLVKLLVIGRGRLPTKLKNVIHFGATSQVEKAYAAADLMTFLPIYEPCANVIAEALCSGLPVITSAMNGASELIQEGVNGHVLSAPEDLDALETKVHHWRAQPNARPVKTLLPLDLETNVRETLRILEQVAAEKKETQASR